MQLSYVKGYKRNSKKKLKLRKRPGFAWKKIITILFAQVK